MCYVWLDLGVVMAKPYQLVGIHIQGGGSLQCNCNFVQAF